MLIDIVVAVIIVLSAIIAFLRGFIREVLTIVGVVGGLMASFKYGPLLIPSFSGWFGVPSDETADMPKLLGILPMDLVAMATAYIVVFVIVALILSVISHFLCGFAKKIGLGPVDRTLGVVFGIARAVFVLAFLYLPFYLISGQEGHDDWFKDSRSYVYIKGISAWMADYVPENTADSLAEGAGQTREEIEQARERMGALDALKEKASDVLDDGAQAPASTDSEGYNENQRGDLNQLIEDTQQ